MFSVIIPLYNKEKYVKRSVESVLNQSYKKFELIVIDDASTDNSIKHLKEINDNRIKIIYRKERGHGGYAARNLGLKLAKYEFVSFLDADDKWNKDYLLRMKDLIEKFPQINVFSCGWEEKAGNISKTNSYYNKNKKKRLHIIDDFYKNSYQGHNPLCTIVLTAKKEIFIDAGTFPEGKCKRGGDIETWLRLMRKEKLAWTPYIGAIYYKDVANTVTKSISDIQIPYVYYSVKDLLKIENDKQKQFEYKKYSNYYTRISIFHSVVFNTNKKEIIEGFYKDVDRKYYYFFRVLKVIPPFILKPLFKMYRKLMLKFSKNDLG